jgi:uncharacterized membrane protein
VIRAEFTTTIDKPVGHVFEYMSDFATLPEYDEWVLTVKQLTPGPVGVGTKWTHTRRQGRRTIEAPIEIIAFEPNSMFAMRSGSGPFDVRSTCTFRSSGSTATTVTEVLEMRIGGLLRVMEPLIRRQVEPQGKKVHAALKRVLESR